MNSIIIELLGVAFAALRSHKRTRLAIVLLSPFAYLSLVSAAAMPINDGLRQLIQGLIFISAGSFAVALLSFTSLDLRSDSHGLNTELAALRREREEIQRRLSETATTRDKEREDVFDTIQLSLNQITEYYTINKSQAVSSFRFSISAVVLGLLTLIAGIWLFYLREPRDITLTAISGIASVLAQFVGAAYFYLYNRSLAQLNFFYTKLVGMQDTMLAIQLAESLPEPTGTEVKQKVILTLVSRDSARTPDDAAAQRPRPRANKRRNQTDVPPPSAAG